MRFTRLTSLIVFLTIPLLSATLSSARANALPRPDQPGFVRTDSFLNPGAQGDAKILGWPQLGFDAGHSGHNPNETTLSSKNVASLTPLWSTPTGGTAGGLVAAGGVLYGQANGLLFALRQSTGAVIWTAPVAQNTYSRAPAVAHGLVFQENSNSYGAGLCSFSVKHGSLGWCALINQFACGIGNTPSIADGLTYVELACGSTYYDALDQTSGNVAWQTSIGNHCAGNGSAGADPIGGGMVYYTVGCQGSDNHTSICAFNAKNGATGWCTPLVLSSCGVAFTLGVSEAEDTIFANVGSSGCAEQLVALNAKTGAQLWADTIPGNNPLGTQPAIAKGIVYDDVGGGTLDAFSAKSGALLWTQQAPGSISLDVSVANGVVYASCGGPCAMDAKTGAILWQSGAGGGSGSSITVPIVLDGVVYGSCGGTYFCAYGLPGNRRR